MKSESVAAERLILDLDVIRELEKLKLDDGAGLLPTLVELFHESVHDIEILQEHFQHGDLDGVRALAHNLKSNAANLGLIRLKCICHKIEIAKTADDMRLSVSLLQEEFALASLHLGSLNAKT